MPVAHRQHPRGFLGRTHCPQDPRERPALPAEGKEPWALASCPPEQSGYLGLDDPLWEVSHGVRQPAFQALGKITDGLRQGTWETQAVILRVRKAVLRIGISRKVRGAHAVKPLEQEKEVAEHTRQGARENSGRSVREAPGKKWGTISAPLSPPPAAL